MDERRLLAEQRRLEEIRRQEAELRREREELERKTAAQLPPTLGTEDFGGKKKGFRYDTWFKAFGTFGDLRDMGDSPHLLGEMEELEDMDVPAAFYSNSALGQAKWPGLVDREKLIQELGDKLLNGQDFREIYPQWEYRYAISESVGNVVVRLYEHKAKQPLTPKDRAKGYKSQ